MVLGQVTALRAAAVHAVAADTPAGVVGDQVVEVVMMALGRSRRSGLFLREQALLLTHQPQVWAALWAGRLDVTKAGILARALYLVPRLDAEDQQRPGYAADCDRILASGLALRRRAHRRAAGPAPQTPAGGDRPGRGGDPAASGAGRPRRVDRPPRGRHRGPDRPPGLHPRRTGLRRDPGPGPGHPTHRHRSRRATGARGTAELRRCRAGAGRDAAADGGDPGRGFAAQAARRPFDLRMADALVDLILTPAVGIPGQPGTATRTTAARRDRVSRRPGSGHGRRHRST